MAKKSKRFRIGVEGATTDGRVIEREWLTQMAASYNPQVYTALINMEHIKGFTPDGPFRRFGMVEKLEAEELTEGALSGKMALYGWIAPTDDLVTMTSNWQKLFTSMEVNTSFADTGSAYLAWRLLTIRQASALKCCSSVPAQNITPWRAASWTKTTCLPLLLKR